MENRRHSRILPVKFISVFLLLIIVSSMHPTLTGNASQTSGIPRQIAAAKEAAKFPANFYLDDVSIAPYTYHEVYNKFNESAKAIEDNFLVGVTLNGKSYRITATDIGWRSNVKLLMQQLWYYGFFAVGSVPDGISYHTTYTYDKDKLEIFIGDIIDDLEKFNADANKGGIEQAVLEPLFNAETREYQYNEALLTYEQYVFDPEGIRGRICDVVAYITIQANSRVGIPRYYLYIDLDTIQTHFDPGWDVAEYGMLGTYTTRTTNSYNRNTNIRIASQAISGTRLAAGDVFSFWELVGQTTTDRGYMVAGILVNGKSAQGMGGGICQVSSTIYNVVLDAGLEVVERRPHSAPVDYVPRGRDATVSYPATDFKFRNSTEGDIYMIIDYDNKDLTVSFYGKLAPQEDEAIADPEA